MATRLLFLITAVFARGLVPSLATAQPVSLLPLEVPPAPANLDVPQGNEVFLLGRVVGTRGRIVRRRGLCGAELDPVAAGATTAWLFAAWSTVVAKVLSLLTDNLRDSSLSRL